MAEVSDGDARRALAALEIGVMSSDQRPLKFTRDLAEQSVQRKAVSYDATGDAHYDATSALIKSLRGSDPDAALYWLARMLEGGEDVRFLCRRLMILASEDMGNADPHALPLAMAAVQACELVGLPECQLTLAQAVTYLACAPKSNAATVAIGQARQDVRERRLLPVPVHLRNCALRRRKTAGTRLRLRVRSRRGGRRGGTGLPGRRPHLLPTCRARVRSGAEHAGWSRSGPGSKGSRESGVRRNRRVTSKELRVTRGESRRDFKLSNLQFQITPPGCPVRPKKMIWLHLTRLHMMPLARDYVAGSQRPRTSARIAAMTPSSPRAIHRRDLPDQTWVSDIKYMPHAGH